MATLARQILSTARILRPACARLASQNVAADNPQGDYNNIGMRFELSEQQLEYQSVARKFSHEYIIPNSAKYDELAEFPWDIFRKGWELGMVNLHVDPKIGGLGIGVLDECIIYEELAYGCTGIFNAFSVTELAQTPLVVAGSEELKKKYLGMMCEEPCTASYCISEPDAGSDVSAIQTKAEKKGDEYILNGTKMWISNAGVASWYFVLARTNPDPKCPPGKAFTGFVVDKHALGLSLGKKLEIMGNRAGATRPVMFEDVRVPKENIVGAEGLGFKIAMATFDRTRPLAGVGALGVASRALDIAAKYALDRKSMGKPLCEHQMVQSMLAQMAINVETSRLLVHKSSDAVDRGLKHATYLASVAKAHAGELGVKNALDCIQILGGNGYSKEYPAEKLLRDAKIFSIYEGATQIQKLIIARDVITRAKQGTTLF